MGIVRAELLSVPLKGEGGGSGRALLQPATDKRFIRCCIPRLFITRIQHALAQTGGIIDVGNEGGRLLGRNLLLL
jgi:hypothetical protein